MNPSIRPLLPLPESLPAYDSAALRRMEALAMQDPAAHPSALMERAGLAAARLARALAPGARKVCVLCGPGNNGGDGWVAARHLHQWGLQVTGHRIGGQGRTEDACAAFDLARAAGVPVVTHTEPAADTELLLDALLGIGLRADPRGEVADAIRSLMHHPGRKLALDVPSGLDADTGRDWGAAASADTLTFLAAKPGLFTGSGRALVGRVWLVDLSIRAEGEVPAAQLAGASLLDEWLKWSPRSRASHATHKGRQGDLWVLGGAMPGAALLAARAGLLAGAGRVYLSGGSQADPMQPELILRDAADERPPSTATVVAGCGWGVDRLERLPTVLSQASRLVLDADGLNAVAASPALQQQLALRAAAGASSILTPHPLEAARLLAKPVADVQSDRLHHAQQLAERFACTVLLKGSGTVIASPGQVPWINTTGHGALASAGTGDVLAGWLGGLWAQAPETPPHRLAALAAAWHGLAAEGLESTSAPLPASQLVQRMHALHP